MKLRTHIFNPRLYVEGLKRLRVLGLGLLILAVVLSAMVPLIHLAEYGDQVGSIQYYDKDGQAEYLDVWQPRSIKLAELSYFTRLVPFAAPLLFFVAFSFLLKRRESDVYHAIPCKRICVYCSLVAAVLSWTWGITLVSSLISGLLWAWSPTATFALSELVALTVSSMLTSALLGGFMLLSITTGGTVQTVVINAVLFTVLPRAVLYMFGAVISDGRPFIDIEYFCDGFFDYQYCMPICLLFGNTKEISALPVQLWTGISTAVLLTVSGFLYHVRRSETVGSSAPNERVQNLFRVLFTLPFALILFVTVWIDSFDEATFIILLVITLLAYYFYELITTKKLRNLLRVSPYLSAVLAGCMLFGALAYGARLHLGYEKIEAEDIESVELPELFYAYNVATFNYEYSIFDAYATEDPAEIQTVAQALRDAQRSYRTNQYGGGGSLRAEIHLKSGRTVVRNVSRATLNTVGNLEAKLLSLMPSDAEIDHIQVCPNGSRKQVFTLSEEVYLTELMEAFRAEYSDLSYDDQKMVKQRLNEGPPYDDVSGGKGYVLEISGGLSEKGEWRTSYYNVLPNMEETVALLDEYMLLYKLHTA